MMFCSLDDSRTLYDKDILVNFYDLFVFQANTEKEYYEKLAVHNTYRMLGKINQEVIPVTTQGTRYWVHSTNEGKMEMWCTFEKLKQL